MHSRIGQLKPYLGRLAAHWRWMAGGALFGLLAVVAAVGLLSLAGWFLSAAAVAGLTAATAAAFNFFFPSLGVRLFAFARIACRYLERVVSHEATFRILQTLRVWFYRKVEPLLPAALEKKRSGDLLNMLVADIDALDNLYLRLLSPAVVAAAMALILFGGMAAFHPAAAGWAFFTFVSACIVTAFVSGKLGMTAGSAVTKRLAMVRVRVVEGIDGLSEMLVYGAWNDYAAALEEEDNALVNAQKTMSHIAGLSSGLLNLFSGVTLLGVLYLGVAAVNNERLDGPGLACIALAAWAAYEAAMPLAAAYQALGKTVTAAGRISETVGMSPTVVFPPAPGPGVERFDLTYETIRFAYGPDQPPALADVSLHIPWGSRVAVVGTSGSGKSTLTRLLARFWDPDDGRVRIGGHDIRRFPESDLRRYAAIVSQRPHMFNGTLGDNLKIAKPDATPEELLDAVEKAELGAFVRSLPDGLDTWIGENGRMISGGQARRIGVARAMLKDAPIWVLDEPTEALDALSEKRLLASLFNLTEGRTMILLTHRMTDLDRMDRIYVMEGGRLMEQGTHGELIRACGRYAAFCHRIR